MTKLRVVIKEPYFTEILKGTKKIEYREVKPFWNSRLFDAEGKRRKYDYIEFVNGYNTDARWFLAKFEGFAIRNNIYCIKVGKIVKKRV